MQQIKIYTTAFLCSAILILSSCSDDNTVNNHIQPVDSSTFIYPFTIGSTWNYTTSFTFFDIHPDSILHYFHNEYGSGTMSILYDTVINGVTARCFNDLYTQNSLVYNSRKYYVQSDTALLVFAYRLSGSSYIFPRNSHNLYFSHCGRRSRSINELFFNIGNPLLNAASDTLIIENPPVRALIYPIRSNTEWFYRYPYIVRRYTHFENLNISNQAISCMKTQLDWSSENSDEFYDYFSKVGKMKSDYFLYDVIVTNEFGDTLGYADSRYVTNVTSFNIITP